MGRVRLPRTQKRVPEAEKGRGAGDGTWPRSRAAQRFGAGCDGCAHYSVRVSRAGFGRLVPAEAHAARCG